MVQFLFLDDHSTVADSNAAVDAAINRLNANFIFGGYSSALTKPAAELVRDTGGLLMSAGAGSPSVFAVSNQTFALSPELPTSVRTALQVPHPTLPKSQAPSSIHALPS